MQNDAFHHTIGIDARMLGPEQTGIGKYIARLLAYVPPLMPEARFVAFLKEPAFSAFASPHANVEAQRVCAHWYSWREQLLLPFTFLRAHVDLMHFPHFNVPLLYRKPFIVTIHDTTPHTFPGHRMGSWARKAAFWLVFRSAVRRAREIIAVSQYTKGDIQKIFDAPPGRMSVIYEGVDEMFSSAATPAQGEILRAYGITGPFILYVGVWREHKNLAGLIEAYAWLKNTRHIPEKLVLLGKESVAYPAARSAIQRLGMENFVCTPGFVPENDLPHFYRAASLTVVPSFSEGFGFTGLESLACLTPVAASCVTSLPEVLGDAAVFFNPYDTEDMAKVIYNALTNNALREQMLQNAKKILPRYQWENMAAATAACYRRALVKK